MNISVPFYIYIKARHAAAPPVLTMRKYAFDVRRYIAQ